MMPERQNQQTTAAPWEQRLDLIVETMREMSTHTDPQEMVQAYSQRMRQILPTDRMVAISRRGLEPPWFRITRSSTWPENINPWHHPDRLPLLSGGLLADLVYADKPQIIDRLEIAGSDPAAEYFRDQQSLIAIPNYDHGAALNMVLLMRREPEAFSREQFPELVWMANLFGRATHTLVIAEELQRAYQLVDHELQVVADIQRSLLPEKLPDIPTMDLAAHYQTSRWAGGDYYDFFPLPDGRWGLLIADVTGHGTPAAVLMAITHSIAHAYPGPPAPPSEMLNYLNAQLARHYTGNSGTFVTAFYGIYDPKTRHLEYSCAGHNPPRLKRCRGGEVLSLDGARKLPLGILPEETYDQCRAELLPGDQIIFYTDGITEAMNGAGEQFGADRLDGILEHCREAASDLIHAILRAVADFTGDAPVTDDRTLLVARIY